MLSSLEFFLSHLHFLLQLRLANTARLGFRVAGGRCSPPALEGGTAVAVRPGGGGGRGGGEAGGGGAAGLGGGGRRLSRVGAGETAAGGGGAAAGGACAAAGTGALGLRRGWAAWKGRSWR